MIRNRATHHSTNTTFLQRPMEVWEGYELAGKLVQFNVIKPTTIFPSIYLNKISGCPSDILHSNDSVVNVC